MKKYPFSKKAVKAILAASIALTPVVTTGIVAPSSVEASSDIQELASRFYQFYKSASKSKVEAPLNDISKLTYDNIETTADSLDITFKNLDTQEKKAAFATIIQETAKIIYTKHESAIAFSEAIEDYRADFADEFNLVFEQNGQVTVDQLIAFLKDMEPALETAIVQNTNNLSYSAIIRTAVNNIKNQHTAMQGKLGYIGLSVEELFDLQEELNDKYLDDNKDARSALLTSALNSKGADFNVSSNKTISFKVPYYAGPVKVEADIAPALEWKVNGQEITGVVIPSSYTGTVTVTGYLKDDIQVVSESVDLGGTSTGGGGGGGTTPPSDSGPKDDGKGNIGIGSGNISDKASEVAKAIKDAKEFKTLQVTISNSAQNVTLPPAVINAIIAKNKEATIDVVSDAGSYSLPASEINLADIAKELGGDADKVSIKITVKVGKDDKNVIGNNKLTAVSDVVEFTVEAQVNGKTKELKTFKSYVDRTIKGDESFDADKSVALRLEADGDFTALPTYFEEDEAKFKSMTNSQYVVVENNKTFNDLSKAWNKEQIEKLANKYIVQGRADGSFGPQVSTTRVQLAVLLTRALGLSTDVAYDGRFKDVKGDEWFVPELMAAVNAGIIKGKVDGTFDPITPVNRAQAAVMINRALEFVSYDKEKELDTTLKVEKFKDESKIFEWSRKDIETLLQAGIMEGRPDGNFDPYAPTTRAQMVKILDETLKTLKFINE
ncbi:S-layer homology domain-containing protein [Priestia abyssalis]|uniref:S-layer homology domain-containing protein n=1 Tax=Priestia abyssalis TaxID=1221450 RepID=UPI0009950797|nr:S-layer homology domain-containing protein [Priestia abyssalis]